MMQISQKLNKYKSRILVLILINIYSVAIERRNFQMQELKGIEAVFLYLSAKLIMGMLVIVFINKVKAVLFDRKQNERIFAYYFVCIAMVYGVFFTVLLRKGIVGSELHSDMILILQNAAVFKTVYFQGWYATVFYETALMVLPLSLAKYGVVILQMLVTAYTASYVSVYLYDNYGKMWGNICGMMCVSPPVFFFAQFTLRETWFTLGLILVCVEYDRILKGQKNACKLCLATAVTSVFRPEGKYVAIVMIISMICHKRLRQKEKGKFIAVIIILTIILILPQKNGNEYRSTPFINPLSNMLVSDEFEWCEEEYDREAIDAVISVEALKKYASLTDLKVLHENHEAWNTDFTDEEFWDFIKVYVKLVCKNFAVFLKVRWMTFWYTIKLGTYGWSYFVTLMHHPPAMISLLIQLSYHSLVPLILINIRLLMRRDMKALIMTMLVNGEAVCIFMLGTQIDYMFHFSFLFAGWIVFLLLCEKKTTELGGIYEKNIDHCTLLQ